MTDDCISDDGLLRYYWGEGSAESQARVQQHLQACSRCQDRLNELGLEAATRAVGRRPLLAPPPIAAETRNEPGPTPAPPALSALPEPLAGFDHSFHGAYLLNPPPSTNRLSDDALFPPQTVELPQEFSQYSEAKDRFRISRELGRGGMGVVYLAQDLTLGRWVALKCLTQVVESDADWQRFLQEAQSIARLDSPNIVQLYEVVKLNGRPALVLEYVAGPTLYARVGKQPQHPEQAARLMAQVVRAIDHAHERGVIHRDIKSGNVLLAAAEKPLGESKPKLTDFGLAKLEKVGSQLTQPGDVLGTPGYLAPEQAEGRPEAITKLVDIYAAGAVLYELLTGRVPFQGATALDTLVQVKTMDPVSVRHLQPRVPVDLETICMRCLQKVPSRRYPTAADLADDLDRFCRGEPIAARPPSTWERIWRWSRRHPIAVSAVLSTLVTLLGSLVVLLMMYREASDLAVRENQARVQAQENEQNVERLRVDAEIELARTTLARGCSLAEQGNAASGLYEIGRSLKMIREFQSDESPTMQARRPEIDRLELAARQASAGWLHQHLIRPRLEIAHPHFTWCGAFSPNGRWLVTGCGDERARIWDAETGTLRQMTPEQGGPVLKVQISPDSRYFAAASFREQTESYSLVIRELETGRLVREHPLQDTGMRWMRTIYWDPLGKWVALPNERGNLEKFSLANGQSQGDLVNLRGPRVMAFAATPTHDRWFVGDSDGRIWEMEPTPGKRPQLFTRRPGLVHKLAVNPQGTMLLVLDHCDDDPPAGDLLTLTLSIIDLKASERILGGLPSVGVIQDAVWSPSGDRIAAYGTATGPAVPDFSSVIWLMEVFKNPGKRLRWQTRTQQFLGTAIRSLRFTPDSECLLVGTEARRVEMIDVESFRRCDTLLRLGTVPDIAIHPTLPRAFIADAGDDRGTTGAIVDLETTLRFGPIRQVNQATYAMDFAPNGDQLVTVAADSTMVAWSLTSHTPPRQVQFGPNFPVFQRAGNRLLLQRDDTRQRKAMNWLLDPVKGEVLQLFQDAPPFDRTLLLTEEILVNLYPERNRVALERFKGDRTVELAFPQVWERVEGRQLVAVFRHGLESQFLLLQSDARSATVSVGDGQNHQFLRTLKFNFPIERLYACPGRETVLITTPAKNMQLWDLSGPTPEVAGPLLPMRYLPDRIAWTPDGRGVVAGNFLQGQLTFWNVEFGIPLAPSFQMMSLIGSLAMHPSGELVAVVDEETLRCWRLPKPRTEPIGDLLAGLEGISGLSLDVSGRLRELSPQEIIERRRRVPLTSPQFLPMVNSREPKWFPIALTEWTESGEVGWNPREILPPPRLAPAK
ncbi:WD40 repeat domain-containing serine/threonine protein kinase [Tuwongella immobilis]|uniref:Protein kinase domain-containing protein n=1 Tax=Tuwongella immobilis TaxID=692036 RepID=A0A6C2YJH7_9BACT|nr:WD40 repeat domain-containing serine/threonine protein kinase [Tuwongella immobilis]VIP01265.1 wd40 repeat-containing protein : WD40 repeat-containing protein OS=Singulisphaera acidiphila (strain ATCC BAA-1392 / DSM 18658 / VKM B-2454 / MOB10) GN=Sinac_3618 PE=4 SV=1: Pkinase: WD40 [Tuwongella immobilis]VTR97956.1 wd40 repeat-containing protein : WD40 repeat-containing protein OS=Singulisphaera acidiphila (strain ATCC BAA-1392 / DSM 18658 / VKM B-2454 / MOB10) GN=Sinac_3618 PE=4 SV=1: Pkinase: